MRLSMKKIILTFVFIISIFWATAQSSIADSYMTMPDLMNSRMFSTDGARPLVNLERSNFNNQEIMKIEAKQNPRKQQEKENNIKEISDQPKEKTKFKDYFKNFVVEW